jgi:lysophospholipase L1-like esterase
MRVSRFAWNGMAVGLLAALTAIPSFASAGQPTQETVAAAGLPAAAPPGPGSQLGTSQAMYPRVVRLQHAGASNGRLIASVSVSAGGGGTDSAQFFASDDGGGTFRPLSTISDPQAAAGRGSCCGSLFELPTGTLLFATTVGMAGRAGRVPAIRVWASSDEAHTWAYLSTCATAPDAPADRGLWEPEMSIDASGALHCTFSDDARSVTGSHTGFDQTIADVTSLDGGHTWGPERNLVAIPSTATTTYRPGMATVRRLPDGTFIMSYELCGTGITNSCEVRIRTSADGSSWGAPTDPGAVVATVDGKHLFHAPTIAWAPGGGPHGRVLLVGELVKDAGGAIQRPNSGSTVLVNYNDGAGPWSPLDAPVTVGFSAAPDSAELVCNNYSSSLLPSLDGTELLELATRRDAAGACHAYFNTSSAPDMGGDVAVASGRTYRLANGQGGLCLDVPGDVTTSGTKLQQWTCNSLDPQNWKLTATSGGVFTLTNERSGLCLAVPRTSPPTGGGVLQSTCSATDVQLWQVVSVPGGVNLVSTASGRCVEVNGGSTTPGAVVQQGACNGTAWQVWRMQRPLTVMPLGDSITDGLDGTGGYRSDLWQDFRADNRYVDFVGSQTAGPALLGDQNHEGHPGWRIDQIDAQATAWLHTYLPDTVLLHIGTNDILQGYALAEAPTRLSTLLDHITAAVPDAEVYVATIVPFANVADESRGQAYNAELADVVRAKASAAPHVHLLDMHAALTAADLLSDGVHPSNGGYSKMAARWYGSLYGASLVRWEAEAAGNTRNDVQPVATVNASGNMKIGHIDNPGSSLDVNVSVAAVGTYRMYVRAADGTGAPCSHTVTVNGQASRELTYPAYGWDQWAIVATDVTLAEGPNVIRLVHSNCFAELDSIDLAF